MRTLTQVKRKAVYRADKTAKAQNYQRQFYAQDRKPSMENLKLQLGEFLLYLQRPMGQIERRIYWYDFESLLRRYLDARGGGLIL